MMAVEMNMDVSWITDAQLRAVITNNNYQRALHDLGIDGEIELLAFVDDAEFVAKLEKKDVKSAHANLIKNYAVRLRAAERAPPVLTLSSTSRLTTPRNVASIATSSAPSSVTANMVADAEDKFLLATSDAPRTTWTLPPIDATLTADEHANSILVAIKVRNFRCTTS